MMPDVHPTTIELWRSLGSGLTRSEEESDYPLLRFLDGACHLLGLVDDVVRDSDEGIGWTRPLDVDRATLGELPWLGQFVGVVAEQFPEGERRDAVRTAAGIRRGRPAAILEVAQRHLTGSKKTRLTERDTSAYHFKLRTYVNQTPDPDALVAAVNAIAKAGGLQWTHELLPGEEWGLISDNFATWQDVKDNFATWDDVRNWIAP